MAGPAVRIPPLRVAGRDSAAADALDRVEIDIEERGNRVIVETDYPRHRRSFSAVAGQPAPRRRAGTIPILVGRGAPFRRTPVFEGGRRAIRGIAAAGGARLELSTVSGDMAIGVRASTLLQPAASRPAGSR